jgi:hypothetical protein
MAIYFRSPLRIDPAASPPHSSSFTPVEARVKRAASPILERVFDPKTAPKRASPKGAASGAPPASANRLLVKSDEVPKGKRAHTISPASFQRAMLPLKNLEEIFEKTKLKLTASSYFFQSLIDIQNLFVELLPVLPLEDQKRFIEELQDLIKNDTDERTLSLILGTAAFLFSRDKKFSGKLITLPQDRLEEVRKHIHQLFAHRDFHGHQLPTGASFYLRLTFSRTLILPTSRFNPLGVFSLEHLFTHLKLEEIGFPTEHLQNLFSLIEHLSVPKSPLNHQLKRVRLFKLSPNLYTWIRLTLKLKHEDEIEPLHGFWAVTTLLFSYLRQEKGHPLCYAIAAAKIAIEENPAAIIERFLNIFETGSLFLPTEVKFDPEIFCPFLLLNPQKIREIKVASTKAPALQRTLSMAFVETKNEQTLPSNPVTLSLLFKEGKTYLEKAFASFEQDPMEALNIGISSFLSYNSVKLKPPKFSKISLPVENVRGWVISHIRSSLGKVTPYEWYKLKQLINSSLFVVYQPLDTTKGEEGYFLDNGKKKWLQKGICKEQEFFFKHCYSVVFFFSGRWHQVRNYSHFCNKIGSLTSQLISAPISLILKQDHFYKSWVRLLGKIEKAALTTPINYEGRVHFSTEGGFGIYLAESVIGKTRVNYYLPQSPQDLLGFFCHSLDSEALKIGKAFLKENRHECTINLSFLGHYKSKVEKSTFSLLSSLYERDLKRFKELVMDKIRIATIVRDIQKFFSVELKASQINRRFIQDLTQDCHVLWGDIYKKVKKTKFKSSTQKWIFERLHFIAHCINLEELKALQFSNIPQKVIENTIKELEDSYGASHFHLLPEAAKHLWRAMIKHAPKCPPKFEAILAELYTLHSLPPHITFRDPNYSVKQEEFSKPSLTSFGVKLFHDGPTEYFLFETDTQSGVIRKFKDYFPHYLTIYQPSDN